MSALKDLRWGLFRWRLWIMLALEELKLRYHRTLFGPSWIVASFLAFILVKIFIFSELSSSDGHYYACWLTLGYMVWVYIGHAINAGAGAFVQGRNWILGTKMPYTVILYREVMFGLINFALVLLASLAITYYFTSFSASMLGWACLGMAAIAFSLFWVQLLLATMSVFLRDVIQMASTVLRIAFFVTPILWVPADLGDKGIVAQYNPFTHYIAIIREPLLDQTIPVDSWIIVGVLTGLNALIAITVFIAGHRRITSFI